MPKVWQPYREPVRVTLTRTGAIAAGIGAVIASLNGGGVRAWPVATLVALWPALGGHFVELAFLNGLRPRLPANRSVQVVARLLVWFFAGAVLAAATYATAAALRGTPIRQWPWWLGGLAFIGIEMVAHLGLCVTRRDCFYNGRG